VLPDKVLIIVERESEREDEEKVGIA
jgi:hypothetical protein